MFQAARRRQKPCCTASCSCRTRSNAPIRSRAKTMTKHIETLVQALGTALGERATVVNALGEVTITVKAADYHAVMLQLRDTDSLHFEQLIDLCGVDYQSYGEGTWDGL